MLSEEPASLSSKLPERIQTAGGVGYVLETEGHEVFAGAGGAHAGLAVNDDLGILRQGVRMGGDGLERDQLGLRDVVDLPLLFFADIDEEGVEVPGVEAGFEFGGGDGLHSRILDFAGGICVGFWIGNGSDRGIFPAEAASGIVR